MTTLLHIVHPYTYKLERMGGPLILDERAEQFKERDKRVHDFIKASKYTGIQTLIYWETPIDRPSFSLAVILEDPCLSIMMPPNHAVSTPYCGQPKEQPGYTTPKEYAKIVLPFKRHYFIGGALEACVADAVCHVRSLTDKPIIIVENLCVTFDSKHAEHLKKTLFPAKEIKFG
ncbi:hypothetical protein J4219_01500 [Candidatus Woesearchaeota archaeon]|nr:hypothetical protein [Candidatus Woesearchaeota archaeon]